MKTLTTLVALFLTVMPLHAQLDRSIIPNPGPVPRSAFPDYTLDSTANGMRVIIVENHEIPTVGLRLLIDRDPIFEGDSAGYVSIAGAMLREGTTTRTKDQIDEEIDQLGASLNSGGSAVFASGLSRHLERLIELMADITLNPSFPEPELQKLLQQTRSALKARSTDPDQIADVVRKRTLYGDNHPYGEIETEATVSTITREMCARFHATYFKPNHAILAVVGDVTPGRVFALVERYFGDWKRGAIPSRTYNDPPDLEAPIVAFVDRPSSVQSVLRMTQTLQLPWSSPDVVPAVVMNDILGGGSSGRLYRSLRETRGLTYDVSSIVAPDELVGSFRVRMSVRNAVTDSAITEILKEIELLQTEAVGEEDLTLSKNKLSGQFVRGLENAETIATYAINLERLDIPRSYYKDYLRKINQVTAQDVQRAASELLEPERMLTVVVGKGSEVRESLAAFGSLVPYDVEGNRVEEGEGRLPELSAEEVLARHVVSVGGKEALGKIRDRTMILSGTMQQFPLRLTKIQKAPSKAFTEFEIVGMMKQRTGFDGTRAWAETPQGIVDLTGDQLDRAAAEAPLNFYDRYAALGFAAEVTGTPAVRGTPCYEVTFRKGGEPFFRHYFDGEEFLRLRSVEIMSTPAGPQEQTVDASDFKTFDGILLPTSIEQTVMGQTLLLKVDSVATNSNVADSVFAKPAGKGK